LVVESTFVSINHDIHECSLCGKIVRLWNTTTTEVL
jgi:hypothetical protein